MEEADLNMSLAFNSLSIWEIKKEKKNRKEEIKKN